MTEALEITVIGDELPYADGAEDELAAILAAAGDRGSGSDELADAARDWPTRYHLSRLRTNLLAPLRVARGDRVLDVGAGTGVNTRWFAEHGAEVVALEPTRSRAECAAIRCADFPDSVSLLLGSLDDYVVDTDDERFDLVVVVGILEYSGAGVGGAVGPGAFLERAASLLRPSGALVVAIENQLGLKYWLGYHEDHLGVPWVGVEGYRRSDIRTWSRPVLGEMIAHSGLDHQRWFYPFPDYKLPVAVLADGAYEQPDAVELVDQLVGPPVYTGAGLAEMLCDERAAHREVLTAGLGRDLANSFLVVAGAAPVALDLHVDGETLAWRFNQERRRAYLHESRVLDSPQGRRMVRHRRYPDEPMREVEWLQQHEPGDEPYIVGRNAEQLVIEAGRHGRLDEVAMWIDRWRSAVDQAAVPVPAEDQSPWYPYRPEPASAMALSGDHLDAGLDNFVFDGDSLHFIDREWEVRGPLDRDLVLVRALWKTAASIISSGVVHFWDLHATVDEVATELSALVGLTVEQELLERWRLHESEFLSAVVGGDIASHLDGLRGLAGTRRLDHASSVRPPFTALHDQLHEVEQRAISLDRRVKDLEATNAALERHLDIVRRLPGIHQVASLRRRLRGG